MNQPNHWHTATFSSRKNSTQAVKLLFVVRTGGLINPYRAHPNTLPHYCGRNFTHQELELIRTLIVERAGRAPAELLRLACQKPGWFKVDGGLKDMSCCVVHDRRRTYPPAATTLHVTLHCLEMPVSNSSLWSLNRGNYSAYPLFCPIAALNVFIDPCKPNFCKRKWGCFRLALEQTSGQSEPLQNFAV